MNAFRSAGFTLTEIMVALLITALVSAGALEIYAVGRSAYQTSENIVRLEERAAYVLTMLDRDIQQAGFWGRHSHGVLIKVPATLPIHCRGNNVSAWAAQPALAVAATNGAYDLPCPAASRAATASDTLTVRFAHAGDSPAARGTIQLRTNTREGILFADGVQPGISPPASTHNLQVYAWYLDSESSEPPLPALRRQTLAANGLIQNQEIMPGVEDFQIQLGIDGNLNGLADRYINPEPNPPGNVVAVRVSLRLRSALPEPGHVDAGPWRSIDATLPSVQPNDNFRRIAVQRTFPLRNFGGQP
jgi:type IV pilus assembly protein PilW